MSSAQGNHLSYRALPFREFFLTILAVPFLTIIHLLDTETAFIICNLGFKGTSLLLNQVKKMR